MDCKLIIDNIRNNLTDYINKYKLESCVIGDSGGIDSALCCALAEPVCNYVGIPLIGLSIPIETNKPDEIERARQIGKHFCNPFQEIDLTEQYLKEKDFFWNNINFLKPEYDDRKVKITNGNLKARARMKLLYFTANVTNGIVLSTDNLTELNLGFWTLHGDVGDLGMIQSLWKTEVYEVSKHIASVELKSSPDKAKAIQDCIDAIPTDGLGITSSDLEQFGAGSYNEVDKALQDWIEHHKGTELNSVVLRYERTHFKRNNPYNFSREDLFKAREDFSNKLC